MKTCLGWGSILLGVWVGTCGGCTGPSQRLNAPPQGPSAQPSDLQDPYVFMVDNGMLYDMCLAEVHFIPHTADINGLGARRLSRYGELLKDSGGTIHLETEATDDILTAARIGTIQEYLASTGLDMTQVTIKAGLPRGRAIEATAAIRIKTEGTVNDYAGKSSTSGAPSSGSAPTGSSSSGSSSKGL